VLVAASPDWARSPQIVAKHSGSEGAPTQAQRFMITWWDQNLPGTGDGDIVAALYDCVSPPGTPFCFGNHSVLGCPCGNTTQWGQGCGNSTGSGAQLDALGTRNITPGDQSLRATDVLPGQPRLFFQGSEALNSGYCLPIGDGRRCCGTSVIRLELVVPNANGVARTHVDVAAVGQVMVGDTRCYQFWYRDPTGSPCGTSFNLSNAYEVTWFD
jgi:hypothetical protein